MKASGLNRSFVTLKEIENYIKRNNDDKSNYLLIPASLSISDETMRQLIDNGFKISLKYEIEWDTI